MSDEPEYIDLMTGKPIEPWASKMMERLASRARSDTEAPEAGLEYALFDFYCRKYVQRSSSRHREMGLQYTEAETHDLASETAGFIANRTRTSADEREVLDLPDIEKEGERLADETPMRADKSYLWTDLVGAIQTGILEERKRHPCTASPAVEPVDVRAEWRDIVSAPKDGSDILAWCVHPNAKYDDTIAARSDWQGPVVARWIDHNSGGWTWHGLLGTFTHWMPLPAAPAIDGRDGEQDARKPA